MINEVSEESVIYHGVLKFPLDYMSDVKPHYFVEEAYSMLFRIVKDHYEKYSRIPNQDSIYQKIILNGLDNKISKEKLNAIYSHEIKNPDEDWLKTEIETWLKVQKITDAIDNVQNYLLNENITSTNVDYITNQVKTQFIKDFTFESNFEDDSIDFFNPEDHSQGIASKFSTGYAGLDKHTGGGYRLGQLWVLLARTNGGKTLFMSNLAAECVKQGHNVLFVSLEDQAKSVIKRLGQNLLSIPSEEYDVKSRDTDLVKNKIKNLRERYGNDGDDTSVKTLGNLHIKYFDSNAINVNQLEAYILEKERKMGAKYKLILIDYIALLLDFRGHTKSTTYERLGNVATDLRSMSIRNDWCTLTASQIKRDSYDNKIKLESIADSAAINNVAHIVQAISLGERTNDTEFEMSLKTLKSKNDNGTQHINMKHFYTFDTKYHRIKTKNKIDELDE